MNQLTEERVREIVREELKAAKGELDDLKQFVTLTSEIKQNDESKSFRPTDPWQRQSLQRNENNNPKDNGFKECLVIFIKYQLPILVGFIIGSVLAKLI